MIAVVQRVTRASVRVEHPLHHAAIGPGLCVLLGVATNDGPSEADWMAKKLAQLRVFRDDENRMNRSIQEIGGQVLLVSQFTLLGDCRKGNRPSFVGAAEPEVGERLYERVRERLEHEHGVTVKTGRFGAMMQVELVNDGPVTLILDR